MTARKDSIDGEPHAISREKRGLDIVKRIPCLYNQQVTDTFVKGLIDKANQMESYMKRFETARSNLLFDAETYLNLNRRTLMGEPGNNTLVEEIGVRFEAMKKEIALLYTVVSESVAPPQIDLFFRSKAIKSCFQTQSLIFNVSMLVANDNVLIVRTPPLVSKQQNFGSTKKDLHRFEYSGWFAQEVEHLFDMSKGRVPQFGKRHISIFRVISTKRQTYPDHDNIDTKTLIDTISLHTGTFDNPKVVSLSQMAVFNDYLKEGCYFVVSPDYNAPPDEKTLLHWIQTATVIAENSNGKKSES